MSFSRRMPGRRTPRYRVGGGAFTGPLDFAASPWLLLSTKRLLTAYTGPCMRVRRSSDNVEADIGFTPAGDLDTVALLAHVGANSGFVRTWYDQSGGTRHAQQAVNATQPRIVNAGTIDTLNGLPAVNHTGGLTRVDWSGTITVTTVGITIANLSTHPSVNREIGSVTGSTPFCYVDFDAPNTGTSQADFRPDGVTSIGALASPGGSRSNPKVLVARANTVAGLARCDYKNSAGTTTISNGASVASASFLAGTTSLAAVPFVGAVHTCAVFNSELADGSFVALRDRLGSWGGF